MTQTAHEPLENLDPRSDEYGRPARLQVLERHAKTQPRILEWVERLTAAGGGEIASHGYEEDLEAMLARTVIFDMRGRKVRKMPGAPCACHSNSAACYEANRDRSAIATGYGLSEDGIWRQHSWVVRRKRQNPDPLNPAHWEVIETTTVRQMYAGFIMTPQECERFAANNL